MRAVARSDTTQMLRPPRSRQLRGRRRSRSSSTPERSCSKAAFHRPGLVTSHVDTSRVQPFSQGSAPALAHVIFNARFYVYHIEKTIISGFAKRHPNFTDRMVCVSLARINPTSQDANAINSFALAHRFLIGQRCGAVCSWFERAEQLGAPDCSGKTSRPASNV